MWYIFIIINISSSSIVSFLFLNSNVDIKSILNSAFLFHSFNGKRMRAQGVCVFKRIPELTGLKL